MIIIGHFVGYILMDGIDITSTTGTENDLPTIAANLTVRMNEHFQILNSAFSS